MTNFEEKNKPKKGAPLHFQYRVDGENRLEADEKKFDLNGDGRESQSGMIIKPWKSMKNPNSPVIKATPITK